MSDKNIINFSDMLKKLNESPPIEPSIKINEFSTQKKCWHEHITVDEKLSLVKCNDCEKEINPMWFLIKMARKESRIRDAITKLNEHYEHSKKKIRCKCQHCGKMTNIPK